MVTRFYGHPQTLICPSTTDHIPSCLPGTNDGDTELTTHALTCGASPATPAESRACLNDMPKQRQPLNLAQHSTFNIGNGVSVEPKWQAYPVNSVLSLADRPCTTVVKIYRSASVRKLPHDSCYLCIASMTATKLESSTNVVETL